MQIVKTYRSKIDSWLLIIMTVPFLLVTGFLLFKKEWVGGLVFGAVLAFIMHILYGTKYTITGTALKVKAGFVVNVSVDINTIKSITETNNIISAPANSLDRIEIAYNKYDSVIISPDDKAGFIADILAINNAVTVTYKR